MKNENQVTVNGQKVKVKTAKHKTDGHRYIFTATVGETTVSKRVTVGAANLPLPAGYTSAQFQKDIDAARKSVAEMAHGREKLKQFEKEID